MDAAGGTWLDGFGISAARKLQYGQVGHWCTPQDGDHAVDDTARTVAVEIDPGDGSSLVVFVRVPNRRDVPGDFHPNDEVCLVMPDIVAAHYPAS